MTNNQKLLRATASMPMKQIDIDGKPYLQRYYAGQTSCGTSDIWLHRFLSSDGDRHVHNHPFEAYSVVLNGGYDEQRHGMTHRTRKATEYSTDLVLAALEDDSITCASFCSIQQKICPMTWHRIEAVQPDTWTLMLVRRDQMRLPFWYFLDKGKFTPVESSPVDWWKNCGTRMIESAGQLIEEFPDMNTDDALEAFKHYGKNPASYFYFNLM